jgi:transcriptional regulator with XRE-family HTH domain
MMNAQTIRSTRVAAEISASLLAAKANINRTRLSQIERRYVQPKEDELLRLSRALEQLIHAKSVVRDAAASVGWPIGGNL